MKFVFGLTIAMTMTGAAAQEPSLPDLEMWRLGCGELEISDSGSFSDTHLYDGEPRTFTDSCYLIRNGDRYLLWDAGLPDALVGTTLTEGPFTLTVERSLVDQLGDLGLTAEDITFVGVSHYHFDHVGQLPSFPASTLLIGARDWDVIEATEEPSQFVDPTFFSAWLGENGPEIIAVSSDHDVFGDGSVLIKATPGHTPGHKALLVRLPEAGDVMLTGDLYHFAEQVANRGVPQFNSSRADTLASMARFDQMADVLDATVVIQHDPRHIERLPTFPESAK